MCKCMTQSQRSLAEEIQTVAFWPSMTVSTKLCHHQITRYLSLKQYLVLSKSNQVFARPYIKTVMSTRRVTISDLRLTLIISYSGPTSGRNLSVTTLQYISYKGLAQPRSETKTSFVNEIRYVGSRSEQAFTCSSIALSLEGTELPYILLDTSM